MDYKYITQLLERYWEGTTSLEEEQILKAFFSQKDIPAELLGYKPLFDYQTAEPRQDVLGDDFDERILSLINEPTPVKAHIITLQQKLKPLFKAAAIVAIMLTLGNAAQVSMTDNSASTVPSSNMNAVTHKGKSVALSDSAVIDTMQHSSIEVVETPTQSILK